MTCPHPDTLLLDELGELPVVRREALRTHVETCARCASERAGLRRIIVELGPAAAPSGANPDGAAFSAGVLAAAKVTPQTRQPPVRRWGFRAAAATGSLAVAAVMVLWITVRPAPEVRPSTAGEPEGPVTGTLTARGGATPSERLSAEILLVRGGRLQSVEGGSLRKSDALAVRVTNVSGTEAHLMAFAWDAAGEVHWLYPAYLDTGTNPRSVPIAAGARDRLLNDVVQPDAPRAGPLRLVTLVAASPLTVKEVEARLAETPARQRRTADIGSLFPGVIAREWSARWEGTP